MEAGNLKINSNREQGNRCWGIKLLVSAFSSPSPYGGEMQELDSANHGWKKQWPSMTPEEEDLISRLHRLLGDRTAEEVESYWKMKERGEFEENKIYKPVCTRLSPSFKFTMDEPFEDAKPSQTGC
ncbi:uncharacterized protein [Elaeis guineensis]|uniref:uncharacterized protein isoform X3 n=1 Tax=Elaeis guineensis var. tenera TaxID=51953 RepID=UPI003C6D9C58